jgi:hypothetical protein
MMRKIFNVITQAQTRASVVASQMLVAITAYQLSDAPIYLLLSAAPPAATLLVLLIHWVRDTQ